MNARILSALAAVATFGLSVAALTHCELAVNLNRGEVDSAVPDGCPICTDLVEGGEAGGEDATTDVRTVDGGDGGVADAGLEASSADGASTDASGDGTSGDAGSDAATDAASTGD